MGRVILLADAVRNKRINDNPFAGYLQLEDGRTIEVFELGRDKWHWWMRRPGSLPDRDPVGPYATAEGAYLAGIGE